MHNFEGQIEQLEEDLYYLITWWNSAIFFCNLIDQIDIESQYSIYQKSKSIYDYSNISRNSLRTSFIINFSFFLSLL